jgi:hypothetical protein
VRCKRTGGSGHVAKRSAAGGGKKSEKMADLQPKHDAPLENLTRGAQRGGQRLMRGATKGSYGETPSLRRPFPPRSRSSVAHFHPRILRTPPNEDRFSPASFRSPVQYPRRPPVSRAEGDNTFDPSPFPLTPFISGPMRHRPAVLAAHATSHDLPTSSSSSFCSGRPIHPRSVRRSASYGKPIRLEVEEFLRMWFLPGHRWSLGMVTLSSRYPSNELVLGLPAL